MNKKSIKTLLSILISALTIFMLCISVNASTELTYMHMFKNGKKDISYRAYDNATYKILSNSNPSVVSAKIDKTFSENGEIKLVAKKAGKTTIKYSITVNGKTEIIKEIIKVKKFENPFQTFTVGKTNVGSYFKNAELVSKNNKPVRGVVKYKLKKGWKLIDSFYCKTDDSKVKKIVNGKKITIKKSGAIHMHLRNKSRDDELYINYWL